MVRRAGRELRALVVDDSAYNRGIISELLTRTGRVRVIGRASDGEDALAQVEKHKPDLVTLDLEMPRMDGFAFLTHVMKRHPVPVIVVSGYGSRENVFRALELGAVDFVSKPGPDSAGGLEEVAQLLLKKVRMVQALNIVNIDPKVRVSPARRRRLSSEVGFVEAADPLAEPDWVLVVAASTGGPPALLHLLSQLPGHAPIAVVVAQHMPEHFTASFAQRLNRASRLNVVEADDEQPVRRSMAYVCPGGRCIELVRKEGRLVLQTLAPQESDRYVPSADRLFRSTARTLGKKSVAVVLTGMGNDGAFGVIAVKEAGGQTYAESPESALVYGMPAAAVQTGRVDKVLPLEQIIAQLKELISKAREDYHR